MRIIRPIVFAAVSAVAASAATAQQAPPPMIMSAYYRCDLSRQARADTIYRQVVAPLLDKQVQAGRLTGYSFFAHRFGGVYRRLDSWTAPGIEQLIAAQEAVMQEWNQTNPKSVAEFNGICGSHDDYIWTRILGPIGTAGAAPAPGTGFLYSRYFTCADEATADMAMETTYADIMNKHLAAGHIVAWGWLSHYMGGTVRRVLNWTGPDLMSVLKAEEMISADMANHYMWGPFSRGCNSHTDYVWSSQVSR